MLVAGAAGGVQAAAPFPHLTATSARTALPSAQSLPGGVKLVGKVTTVKNGFAIPCSTNPTQVTLPGSQTITAVYATSAAAAAAKTELYRLGVAVFTTPAKATAATARLNAGQKGCPAMKTTQVGAGSITVSRTLAVDYAVGAWSGYRVIVHVSGTSGTTITDQRIFETYLTRGNVIVSIEQLAPSLPGDGPTQAAHQSTVTALMLTRLAAAKG